MVSRSSSARVTSDQHQSGHGSTTRSVRRRAGSVSVYRFGDTAAAPGSALAGLVVSDIEAAHGEVVGRGIDASDVWHGPPFPPEARQPGVDPERTSYGSFFSINDPDGNLWLVQEVTTRLPGRVG